MALLKLPNDSYEYAKFYAILVIRKKMHQSLHDIQVNIFTLNQDIGHMTLRMFCI